MLSPFLTSRIGRAKSRIKAPSESVTLNSPKSCKDGRPPQRCVATPHDFVAPWVEEEGSEIKHMPSPWQQNAPLLSEVLGDLGATLCFLVSHDRRDKCLQKELYSYFNKHFEALKSQWEVRRWLGR